MNKKYLLLFVLIIIFLMFSACSPNTNSIEAQQTMTTLPAVTKPSTTEPPATEPNDIKPYTVTDIVETTSDDVTIDVLQPFFRDNIYIYYFANPSISYMVIYADGTTENLVTALRDKHIAVEILDDYNVKYYTENNIIY